MGQQPEYEKTEQPLIRQLVEMGWTHLEGAPPGQPATDPAASGRTDFRQVVYPDRFKAAVARLNPGPDGQPWLSEAQLNHLLARIQGTALGRGNSSRGVAGNVEVTALLRKGAHSESEVPGWRRDKDPARVRLVDWEGKFPSAKGKGNDLLVVSQFRVERQGQQAVTPDLVLFVNGLPWAVIECKAPLVTESVSSSVSGSRRDRRSALDDAVDQVIRYAGAESENAVPEFVRYAQVLIGTDRDHAELGTVTAEAARFAPWRTVFPAPEALVRDEVGKAARTPLTAQEVLVAGVLRPAHLLTLVRDFSTEMGGGRGLAKVIGRYQQFRAVGKLAGQLAERRGKIAAGEPVTQRGGVVWHTQGSGKSLTMALLVRHLRSTPGLDGHKVVVVTDRLDLQKQIRGSLAASNETIHQAKTVAQARSFLTVDVPDVVLITLQKAQKDDTGADGLDEEREDERLAEDEGGVDVVHNEAQNTSSDIVVLVDEAHRGQAYWQHARLRAMLPNAVFVGFTGTPIISGKAKTTEDIFGAYADLYTLRDAELDRAVVPVRYEAWNMLPEVIEKAALDAKFDEKVPPDPELRAKVLRKFARRKEILEAPSVIAAKAEHMLRHWATTALPDRFGAQAVAVSRKAAVRYREALLAARDRLLVEIDGLDQELVHDPLAMTYATDKERELLTLVDHRAVLASIDAAVVISEVQSGNGRSDPDEWRDWTLKSKQNDHIERFKKGIGDPHAAADDPAWEAAAHGTQSPGYGTVSSEGEEWHGAGAPDVSGQDAEEVAEAEDGAGGGEAPMAFLVVQSMLLTGFDAPVEQVLYLDCALSGAGLLQAVARTNRPYPHKEWGQIVDYIGIGAELARSLGKYDQAHLQHVYGYDDVTAAHLAPDYQGAQPDRDGLLLKADEAAKALLKDLHQSLFEFLAGQRIDTLADFGDENRREDLLAALEDPLLRGDFDERAREFLSALNAVLPQPEALKYEKFAGILGETQYLVRQRYLDGRDDFSPRRYGAKVRQLISRHLAVTGIEQRVPPVEITDPEFMARVSANRDPRARTSYMTNSLRLRITAKLPTQPARYQQFSERLDEIVQEMRQDFEQAAAELSDLVGDVLASEAQESEEAEGDGLDPRTERPVYEVLLRELGAGEGHQSPPGVDFYVAARELSHDIAGLVRSPDIVYLPDRKDFVRKSLRHSLRDRVGVEWRTTGHLAGLLVDLAVEGREYFLRYEERQGRDD